MLKIMIVGATSAIAHATAKHFAADGGQFYLVARDQAKLDRVRDDLTARGATAVHTDVMDAADFDRHAAVFDAAVAALDGLDVLMIAHGVLTDEDAARADVAAMRRDFDVNFVSVASILTHAAHHFEAQRRGSIAVISSVAGDRGRGSNTVYGTAMAARTAFTSGLRNRLAKAGVDVLTVKPGFVDTPMTAHLKKNPLYASADSVGETIYKAMKGRRDLIYTPFFWRYIMFIIRSIPEAIFKRLGL